jgi:hypothetical protein
VRRAAAIVAGAVLIVTAFIAAGSVADTREGLIAEITTLLAGLAGVIVLLYGLVPSWSSPRSRAPAPARVTRDDVPRTANDLVVGAGGLIVGAILIAGLLWSAGWTWALVGGIVLLPMLAGCAYLLALFARARRREWRIDVRRLTGSR